MKPQWSLPPLTRTARIVAATTLATSIALYVVFLETDYQWALSDAHSTIWSMSEQQETAGDLQAAEQLMRKIVWIEERRTLLTFGTFYFFEGPLTLAYAKLKLADLLLRQNRRSEADATYRDALSRLSQGGSAESRTWRVADGRVSYAKFLLETGRRRDAREQLALAAAEIGEPTFSIDALLCEILCTAPHAEAEKALNRARHKRIDADIQALRNEIGA